MAGNAKQAFMGTGYFVPRYASVETRLVFGGDENSVAIRVDRRHRAVR